MDYDGESDTSRIDEAGKSCMIAEPKTGKEKWTDGEYHDRK